MSVACFDEKAVERAVCSEVSSMIGLPVPVSVIVKNDKIELSLPNAMRDEMFRLLCICVEVGSKRGHWQTFYEENKAATEKAGIVFSQDFALAICCCKLKWQVKGEIKDIWVSDKKVYVKDWEVHGEMYKYCVVLSEAEVTEAMKTLISQILMRPVECQAVISDDYLCVRFPNRLTTSDLQKICSKILFPSEDHMAANSSEETDTVPDIGEELVFDLLADYFNVPSVKNMGLLNKQVVCIL